MSTFMSLASLRIGGLAKTVSAVGTIAIKSVAGAVTTGMLAVAVPVALLLRLGAADETPYPTRVGCGFSSLAATSATVAIASVTA